MAFTYSKSVSALKTSLAADILKLTDSDIISFAGGLPADETFPIEEVLKATEYALRQQGVKALQYGVSEGYEPLRAQIADRLGRIYGSTLRAEHILLTSGSQQALDMIGRMFCDPGSVIIVEKPTYLGAVMAFDLLGVRYREIEMDDEGMRLDVLQQVLEEEEDVRMIYVIPDFHNPTGATWSLQRRKDFLALVQQYQLPIIEDNPYGEIRFRGTQLPSLQALDEEGIVLSCGTFSKTFAPGLRIGWVATTSDCIKKIAELKICSDLSTGPFVAHVASAWLAQNDYDAHLAQLRALYRARCDAMLAALDEMMPEGFTYTRPEGGLFTWVRMPEHMDGIEVLKECLKEKVAFVPGCIFFTTPGNDHYFRLNYSCSDEETIREGVRRLTGVLRRMM